MGSKKSSTDLADAALEPAPEPVHEPAPAPMTDRERELAAIDEKRAAGWRTIEEFAEAKFGAEGGAAYWKFKAVKALMGWSERLLVSEEEFDAAVAKEAEQTIR